MTEHDGPDEPAAAERSAIDLTLPQADAACAVAGHADLVLVVGPAGTGRPPRSARPNLPSLDYSKLSAHIAGDPDLEVASGFANTDKHHTRHGPDPLKVKISNTLTGPTGARVTLTYSSPKRTVQTCDALDLAERCLQSWRAFLSSQGIALP